jgi:hypothetical protein
LNETRRAALCLLLPLPTLALTVPSSRMSLSVRL